MGIWQRWSRRGIYGGEKRLISRGLSDEVKLVKWCTYDAVIGAALAAEVEGFVVFDAVVDHTIREHGLIGDAEDEDAEGEVLGRLGVPPHIYCNVSVVQCDEKLSQA